MRQEWRSRLRQIFAAGLAAVAPDGALLRHVRRTGDRLQAGNREYDLSRRRLIVLGAGKGAAPMAAALENLLGDRIAAGCIVVKYAHGLPLQRIHLLEAAHPVPDQSGEKAAWQLLCMAKQATADDLIIALFTGGASALTPLPAPGISLEDIQQSTSLLLRCGASIDEVNAIRKHLSRFSGGQLARAAAPATLISLIVSDVVGDRLDVIASGPTAPDSSTFASCAAIVQKFHLENQLPPAVRTSLRAGLAGQRQETPKAGDTLFDSVQNLLIATNRQALQAAADKAEELGYEARILTDTMTGEAKRCAVDLTGTARQLQRQLRPQDKPLCLLAGGESTVTLRGKGTGGRNQEMALAASLAMEGITGISALFAGTDGTDGPTDAAGGFADDQSAAAIRMAGLDPAAALDNNDSYPALRCGNTLFITGPTRTNVMDMALILVHPCV